MGIDKGIIDKLLAHYKGPAFSDTISHATPALCMKVPTSETASAIKRLREVGTRKGRQRLGVSLGF
jgi:hypothetical protein